MTSRNQKRRDEPASRRGAAMDSFRSRLAAALCVVAGWCLTSSSELRGGAPVAADFAELTAAVRPLETFLAGNVLTVGKAAAAPAFDSPQSCNPFPADARILAYEEHRDFVCAVGDASHILQDSSSAEAGAVRPQFIRRGLLLKPNIFVVDDFLRVPLDRAVVSWTLGCRSRAAADGKHWTFAAGDQQLVWETLWPADTMAQQVAEHPGPNATVRAYGMELPARADGVRLLQVFHVRKTGEADTAVSSTVGDKDGLLTLAISTPQRTFHLTLPRPGGDAGDIAIQDAAGNDLTPRRPLGAGILPHGPEGVRLVERWDSAYRDGRTAPWDKGIVAPALKQAVESGAIKPCRTVTLGCGTGTNAIYLASQGFDVTAIDVAPTALGLAADKADRAGVRVRWLLADVLALPDLEPFDLVFDRGCYHNVRYVDAAGFVESLRRLTRPGSKCLILSCNRDAPPGVREQTMRDDFSALFEFEWLRDSGVESRDGSVRRESWSLLMRRK